MKLYAHAPYDVDSDRLDEAIGLMRLLQAGGVVIASHEPENVYGRLYDEFPGMDWLIRVKGSRAWWPSNLNAREWPVERSPMEAIQWLVERGIRPLVVLWNEPDLELPDPWKADDPDERQRWLVFYRDAAERSRVQLRLAFGSSVDLALAPLSQGGPPDRFTDWVTGLTDLYAEMDAIVEHTYTDGRPYDDPEWGGRYLRWAEWAPSMPLLITETNDNAAFFGQVPSERAADYAGYAYSVAASGKVKALTEFILPGSRTDHQQPAWWKLTPEICRAVRDAVDSLNVEDALAAGVDVPVALTPPPPPELSPRGVVVPPAPPITSLPEEVPTMPTMDDLHRVRWETLGVEYNPGSGIAQLWRGHPELGSAMSGEIGLDDGPDGATVGQPFAGGLVVWDADKGARLAL